MQTSPRKKRGLIVGDGMVPASIGSKRSFLQSLLLILVSISAMESKRRTV